MRSTADNIPFFVWHYARQLCGVRRPLRPERCSVGLRLLLKLQSPAARKLSSSGCSGSSGGASPSLFLESRGARRRWTGAAVLSTEVWRNFSPRKETAAEPPTDFFFGLVGHGIRAAEGSQAFGLRKETKLSLASRQLAWAAASGALFWVAERLVS